MSSEGKPLSDVLLTVSEEARKSVEAMIDGARHFWEQKQEIPPAVSVVSPDGEPNVFPAIHRNDVEKACVWAFIRFLRATHPVVLLISEIWASEVKKEEDVKSRPRPSEDPNRTELVMITLWEGDRTLWISADINRNPDTLGEFLVRMDTADEGCTVTGALAEGESYKGKERYGRR